MHRARLLQCRQSLFGNPNRVVDVCLLGQGAEALDGQSVPIRDGNRVPLGPNLGVVVPNLRGEVVNPASKRDALCAKDQIVEVLTVLRVNVQPE